MKLKSKLIGILGTAVVATTALTTVVACKNDDTQPTYSNTVIFKGERYLAPVAGSRTFVITGFSLYKELGKDNYDAVDVYASTNEIKASIVEGTRPTTKDFNVKVTAQILDSSVNQKIGFNLVFVFYKNSKVSRKFSISSFSFNYRAVWDEKEIEYCGDASKTFTTDYGSTSFATNSAFRFANGAILASDESIYAKVTRNESGVDVEDFIVTATPQNNKIRLSLQLKSLTEEEIYTGKTIEGLTIELGIKYGNETKWSEKFTGFTFVYSKKWTAPQVQLVGFEEEQDRIFTSPSAGKTEITFTSTVDKGFILDDQLEANEKVEATSSDSGFSIETSLDETRQYINFKFVIDETHKDFDKYKEKNFTFVLAFTFTNETTGETKQQILLEKPFVIHYIPEAETEYFELLLPSSYTCIKGEHLVSIVSYLHKPDSETWPATSPLTAMSITGSGEHGGTIKLNETLPFDQQYEYKFATTYLDLTPNDDTVAEDFTVDFTCVINGETREYEDIVISYVPYNDNVTNPNEYIQDRTLSLMLGYVDDSGQQSETATAWLLNKVSPADDTDQRYYVATTWKQRNKFKEVIDDNIHSPTANLVCGVSDYNMGGLFEGKYYNSLNENYYYLQPSAFTFLSDSDCYDNFTWETSWIVRQIWGTWGCDVNVMTIDFSQIMTLAGGINYYRNIEHQRDITNKLRQLNRYAQKNTANHNNMTDLLATPITSDTGAQYFYLGGFGEIEIDPYGEGAILSPYWQGWQIPTSDLEYITTDNEFTTNHGTLATSPDTVNHRTYAYLYEDAVTSAWFDDEGAGSILLARLNDGSFRVAAIYSGNYHVSSTTREPMFDVFWSSEANLFADWYYTA